MHREIIGVRYVEAKVRRRATGRERGFAASCVYQLDRFRRYSQPRGKELAKPCTRDDESPALALEDKPSCSLSFGAAEQRCQRMQRFAADVQTTRHDLHCVVHEPRTRAGRPRIEAKIEPFCVPIVHFYAAKWTVETCLSNRQQSKSRLTGRQEAYHLATLFAMRAAYT